MFNLLGKHTLNVWCVVHGVWCSGVWCTFLFEKVQLVTAA